MRKMIASIVLVAAGSASAAAQPVWSTTELTGGSFQFQHANEDGASIILVCGPQGVNAGFEFPEPVEAANRATLRAVPGERENVAVAPVNERLFQLTGGRGVDAILRMLRTTATLNIRVGGEQAAFGVFGSESVVSECLQRQEAAPE